MKIVTYLLLITFIVFSFIPGGTSQAQRFQFISGTNTSGEVKSGVPPTREEVSMAGTANSATYYMFGGIISTIDNYGFAADLWSFTVATRKWTLLSGNPNNVDESGVLAGRPTPRIGYHSWVDNTGALFLFGGFGYTPNLDYCKY